MVSAATGLPVLDADSMGRAFPELQMISSLINGCKATPAMLLDDKFNRVVITSTNPLRPHKTLEELMRPIAVSFGSIGGLMLAPLSKQQVINYTVQHSYSGIWKIGKQVFEAVNNSMDPVQSILEGNDAKLIFSGKIIDVDRKTTSGFNVGCCTIQGLGPFQNKKCKIDFQNEFLVAKLLTNEQEDEGKIVAAVPNIISVVDSSTGHGIQTEELRFGFRVSVLCMAISNVFHTPQALKIVGPKAFGYDGVDETTLETLQGGNFTSLFEQ